MKVSIDDLSTLYTENTINIQKEGVLIVSLLDNNEHTSFDYYWEDSSGFDKQKKLKFHNEYDQLYKKAKRTSSSKKAKKVKNKERSFLNVKSNVEGFKWVFNTEDTDNMFIILFDENLSSSHLEKFMRRLNVKIGQKRFMKERQ